MAEGNTFVGIESAIIELDPTITVTSELAGYPAANAATWPTSERWTTTGGGNQYFVMEFDSARTFTHWGIFGHTLANVAGAVNCQYFNTGTSAWTWVVNPITATGTRPIFRKIQIGGATSTLWRLWFSTSGAFSVGNIYLGNALQLPAPPGDGFRPPIFSQSPVVRNNRAHNGALLGRTLTRTAGTIEYSHPLVDETWSRANLPDLQERMELQPFYFNWDGSNYPDDVGFCWVNSGDFIVRYNRLHFHELSIKMQILTR